MTSTNYQLCPRWHKLLSLLASNRKKPRQLVWNETRELWRLWKYNKLHRSPGHPQQRKSNDFLQISLSIGAGSDYLEKLSRVIDDIAKRVWHVYYPYALHRAPSRRCSFRHTAKLQYTPPWLIKEIMLHSAPVTSGQSSFRHTLKFWKISSCSLQIWVGNGSGVTYGTTTYLKLNVVYVKPRHQLTWTLRPSYTTYCPVVKGDKVVHLHSKKYSNVANSFEYRISRNTLFRCWRRLEIDIKPAVSWSRRGW